MSAEALLLPLHGIGSRRDLPLPFGLVLLGSAIVLVVTFWLLAKAWREPRYAGLRGRPLPRLTALVRHPVVAWTARVLVLLVAGWLALALVAGPDRIINPVFGWVFVVTWVGLVPVSLLAGPVWSALHPVRTVLRSPLDPEPGAGVWPAALGIVAFSWLELVEPGRTSLGVLRGWVVAWLVVVVGGSLVRRAWVGSADPFDAYARLVSRLSPLQRAPEGFRLANPLRGLLHEDLPRWSAALACALLAGTAFDSFGSTTVWVRAVQASTAPRELWGTAGLLGSLLVVAGTYVAACAAMRPHLRAPLSLPRLADAMAVGLVPIVVGYALGHYLTLLVIEGQRTVIQLSDPLGRGWDVLGTAERGVVATFLTYPTVTALLQLLFILGGHVVGVVAAHDRAVALLRPERAVRAQVPMLAVMVLYTVGGLVLLFSP